MIEATMPYAHASNGVAEWSNRTIVEGVQCTLSDSDLPPRLWANAVHYQVDTRNLEDFTLSHIFWVDSGR